MHAENIRVLQTRMLQRLADAVSGHELIEFLGPQKEFESFVALFNVIDLDSGNAAQMKDGAIYLNDLHAMVRMHAEHRTSHVLITGRNENWGAFSTTIPNRTVDWGDWYQHLANAGLTPEAVRKYLDDPAVRAVVTPHHTVFWHPKILSLPCGPSMTFMKTLEETPLEVHHRINAEAEKPQPLLINNSGWEHREQINERVSANFDGRVYNTFRSQLDFFRSVTDSQFVLCPSGLGWDTSRIWETLILGSIPIIEFSLGWHTVLDDLPVLFVTNFDEVTPALLARAYPEILSRCESYDFGKLTKRWWVTKVTKLLHASRD